MLRNLRHAWLINIIFSISEQENLMVGSSIQLEETFLLVFVLDITHVLTNIDLMETFNLDTFILFNYKTDDQNKGKHPGFNPSLRQRFIVWVWNLFLLSSSFICYNKLKINKYDVWRNFEVWSLIQIRTMYIKIIL